MYPVSQKPRIRVFSVVRKMNPSAQGTSPNQQMMRVPKQESAARRYTQQAPPPRQTQPRQNNTSSAKNGKTSTVMIEEVPNNAYLEQLNNHSNSAMKVDEDKLPVFLIKLWNIVEDSNLQSIVHWDESGASFHIADPYSFCKNVLPHFFKHNNLNSLIRQLNMYGFRKMTPLSQGGLTRTESDQDHLEFSHPCFIQGRPDLLTQIKRKQSVKVAETNQANEQTQQNLEVVMAEMRAMREKARNMEDKMGKLTKENHEMWSQMSAMRQQHTRQQQYFKKLLHFLVSVMQPGLSKRVAKRGVLEIDFGANMAGGGTNGTGGPNAKRQRMNADEGPYKDVCDLLESLQRETQEPFNRRFSNNMDHGGPLISEVTDEFGNSPAGRNSDLFSDFNAERVPSSRYSDSNNSREASPHPIVSQPSSSHLSEQKTSPETMYMGSGALTRENINRAASKRDYGQLSNNLGANGHSPPKMDGAQKRNVAYKQATRQNQPQQQQFTGNYSPYVPNTIPSQLTYQSNNSAPPHHQNLMAIEDQPPQQQDPHRELYSPTLELNPSFDRQLSAELQDYLTGYDSSLDSFRDLMNSHNWDNFGDNLPLDDDEDGGNHHHQNPSTSSAPSTSQYPLALKNEPESSFYDDAGDLLDPLFNDSPHPEDGFEVPDPNYMPLAAEEIFPRSPVLRTPSPSDPNLV